LSEVRDFGIAVSNANRLNECFKELTDHLIARPAVEGDQPHWATKAFASPGNEDWVHATNSRNVAEMLLRCAVRDGALSFWIRLQNEESAVDSNAIKDLNHRSFTTGAYLVDSDSQSFLCGRPLWIKSNDWREFFDATMLARYGENDRADVFKPAMPPDASPHLTHFLTIWSDEADEEHASERNRSQARLGNLGLAGGSDYVKALCATTELTALSTLAKIKSNVLASQNLQFSSDWVLSLYDRLAIDSRKHANANRLRIQGNGDLADRFHHEGRARVIRELAKWRLEQSLVDVVPPEPKSEVSVAPVMPQPNHVSKAALARWWKARAKKSENVPENEIHAAAIAEFPDHKVSRRSVRELIGPRKRGPKPIR